MDISSLSSADIILLKANFEYAVKLRCEYKIEENIKRGYDREISERTVKGEHGCDEISNDPIYQIDDLQFYTCPCNFKHPHFDFIIQAANAYENGILPFTGSLIDQPANIMDAINLISNLKIEHSNEQQKTNKEK